MLVHPPQYATEDGCSASKFFSQRSLFKYDQHVIGPLVHVTKAHPVGILRGADNPYFINITLEITVHFVCLGRNSL